MNTEPLPKIVILGSLNMDFVVRVERLPEPGETVLGSGFQMLPGGKGANQACAAGRIGSGTVDAAMAGRVGYDLFADHLKASLATAGVDVSRVFATKAQPTGVALIWVDRHGQNSIVVASGANHTLSAADAEMLRPAFTGASYALFQLETPVDAVEAALALARELGVRTILDPAPAQPLSTKLLSLVDILTPNESEASLLLGRPAARLSPEDAPSVAAALCQKGSHAVVLKMGDRGCFYSGNAEELFVPAFPVSAVDSTAAGDVFNAALAVALAEGRDIADTLRFANAASAISVTRVGAQPSAPTRSEVDEFLKSCAS
jgi:ribokinase